MPKRRTCPKSVTSEVKTSTFYHVSQRYDNIQTTYFKQVEGHILYNGITEEDYKNVCQFGDKSSGFKTTSSPQDFEQLRQYHIQNKTLFKDEHFPPEMIKLKEGNTQVVWKRPCEISLNPHFVMDGITRFDIDQGYLGDCWFLAAIVNLTANPKLFKFIVPEKQDFRNNYAGIFHFRFWQYGRWIDVVIDDRLPTVNNQLIYLRSSDSNEFWAPLLEKAYAKLYGSYKNIEGGQISEALEDMCGGFSESYRADTQHIYEIMKMSYERSSFMGCSIVNSVLEGKRPDGLITRHAYSITKVKTLMLNNDEIKLVRIRNPWGNDAEWNGKWSDNSEEWNQISPSIRNELLSRRNDGEFWMEIKDFQKCFTYVDICHLHPSAFLYEDEDKIRWNIRMFEGAWIPHVSAGGGYVHSSGSYKNNPQYLLSIKGNDDNGMYAMLIGLMQKNRRIYGKSELPLELAIYKVSNADLLDKAFFENNTPILLRTEEGFRQLSVRILLPCGTYCIIPSTSKPNTFAEYLLRIYSEASLNIMENDFNVNYSDQAVLRHPAAYNVTDDNSLHKLFKKVSCGHMEVGWEAIREALNTKYGKKTTCFSKSTKIFSKYSCKHMVALWDKNYSGALHYEEFSQLMKDVAVLRAVFRRFDEDNSGKLDGFELRNLFFECGYKLNRQILTILLLRYGHKGYLDFENFVVCAFKLKMMIDEFYKRKNTDVHDYINIDRKDWLAKTLYS